MRRRHGHTENFGERSGVAVFLGLILCFCTGSVWSLALWPTFATVAALLVLTAGFIIWSLARRIPLRSHFALWLLAAATLWCLVQIEAGWTVYSFETLRKGMELAGVTAAFWLGLQIFVSSRLQRQCRLFLIVFGSVMALTAILQHFSADGTIYWIIKTPYGGTMSPFLNRNHFAAMMELLFPVALWTALKKVQHALLYGMLAALIYASVIASASRTGSIMLTLEAAVLLIPELISRWEFEGPRHVRNIVLLSAIVAAFTAALGWQVLVRRFFEEERGYALRFAFLQSSAAMVRERPLTGFGMGTWPIVYPRFQMMEVNAFVNHAHNDWAELTAEGGILFLILLLLLAARALWLAWRLPWALGLFAVLLHALGDFPLQKYAIVLCYFLTWSCAEAGAASAKKRARESAAREDPISSGAGALA